MHLFYLLILFIVCIWGGVCFSFSAFAQTNGDDDWAASEAPVYLTADEVENDEGAQTVTAYGAVELVQNDRILRADRISYNLERDIVMAFGDIVINEPTGETYFADEFELTDGLKNGFATGIRGLLTDGGKFWAVRGEREAGVKLVMKEARYTPCNICEENPEKAPLWQLKARRVTHDEESKRIIYNDARLEIAGVPVFYTPYFAHPDGSIDQKSGFLTPRMGYDSQLGATYEQRYYAAIAPDKDATIGLALATNENPLALGEYRQRFKNALFEIDGGATISTRQNLENGLSVTENDEFRGFLRTKGIWDINSNWRAGINSELASDDQFYRQYNISSEDVLESNIYAERFSGRDYAIVQASAFQDIRTSELQEDQPALFPRMNASFLGDPGQTFGGRWSADMSLLNLFRDGNDQDVSRISTGVGWERRFISDIGLVATVDGNLRGDYYYVNDNRLAQGNDAQAASGDAARGFAQGQAELSYPLIARFGNRQVVMEPVGAITAGSNVGQAADIPNEDSQDIVVNALNLFESNRFTGYDAIEDRSRATYGLRSGLYFDKGYKFEAFAGQSYRLDSDEDDNPFPQGSGLNDDESDLVGQISAQFGTYLDADYRFQLDSDTLKAQRHNLDAYTSYGPVSLGGRYFYDVGLQGTVVSERREQLTMYGGYNLTDQWRVSGSGRYDFGVDEGLRTLSYGVSYTGQCMTLSALAQRTLTTDTSGDSGTEIFLQLGLKNLGEFSAAGLSFGGAEE